MPKWTGKNPLGPEAYTKIYKQLRKLEAGEVDFSREEHTNYLSNAKWSSHCMYENIHTRNIVQCIYIYYICMYYVCMWIIEMILMVYTGWTHHVIFFKCIQLILS